MKWIILITCVAAFAYATVEINPNVELPDELTVCDARDAKRDECFLNLFQKLLTLFRNGVPSLNIPSSDPFHTENNLFEFKNGFLFGQLIIKSADFYGLSNTTFKKIKTQFTKNELVGEFNAVVPEILLEGFYKGKGEFNGLKIQSKGFFNISMSDVNVTTKFSGKFFERDGEKYFKLIKADMNPKVGDMKIFATGLLPDPALNDFVLNLANQYWRSFYEAMLPDARVYFEPIILESANNITLKIPVRRIVSGV